MSAHILLWYDFFSFSGKISKRGTAGVNWTSNASFWESSIMIHSHSGFTSLHSHQQWTNVPFSPQPHQHLLSVNFLFLFFFFVVGIKLMTLHFPGRHLCCWAKSLAPISWCVDGSHSFLSEVKSQCCCNLHFSSDQWYWVCLHAFIWNLHIFIWEICVHLRCLFLEWVFEFGWLGVFQFFICSLYKSYLRDCWLKFFPILWVFFSLC